ncbi:hypothetical protein [Antribacter gilvus]|uniref:hypothetical protein n=1 Tax=Antribacter gilvus TaxID=2304675 RepID=UPI000F79AE5A|nr:hypothetical protein [Antribacter gilvus]
MRRRALVPLVLAAVLALAGCTGEPRAEPSVPTAPPPADPGWSEIGLPPPPGPAGRVALRDATVCDGRWYVVGGVFPDDAPGGAAEPYPAAWTSADGRTFEPVEIHATGFWALLATLTSVACGGPGTAAQPETVVAVGSRSGGAHGNPRVSTFHGPPTGPWVDVPAPITLYGGSEGMVVYGVAPGPEGWLIPGGRTSGGAAWTSPDGTEFTLVDDDPELTSSGDLDTLAVHAVHDGEGWTVVGSAGREGRVPRVPLAWVSVDGRTWQRQSVPEPEGFGSLDRVVRYGDGVLAAGVRDEGFGVWSRAQDGEWADVGAFGALSDRYGGSPYVADLDVVADGVLAVASDRETNGVWWADAGPGGATPKNAWPRDAWREVRLPVPVEAGADHTVSAASDGDEVLLLTDDETAGRLWAATRWPPSDRS